jgi:hypothetical protein
MISTIQSPRKAKSLRKMKRSLVETKDFWLLVDGSEVIIVKQRNGERSTATITIPKKDFNRLIDFYNKPQLK